MDKRTVILVAVLFGLIILGMFTFAFLKKTEVSSPEVVPPTKSVEVDKYPQITRITAKHFYNDGKHTFVGEIEMPTPCDLLDTSSIIKESFPEQVTLKFFVINNSDNCIQKITNQRFLIEVNASENATFDAMFMDRFVELNLIPPAPGETPNDFELFIKG